MASEEENNCLEPDMFPSSGSEIEGAVVVDATGSDGITRPVFVNQFQEEVLALTYEDTIRLHKFLGNAIKFLDEYKNRITQ